MMWRINMSYEQSMMVERSILEEYADKLADRIIKNYSNHLAKHGQDLGGKGEWMVRELVKKKVTYVAHVKVKVTQKELDALFKEGD